MNWAPQRSHPSLKKRKPLRHSSRSLHYTRALFSRSVFRKTELAVFSSQRSPREEDNAEQDINDVIDLTEH
jgi:hypothetical protein